MYDYITVILGAVCVILGIAMVISPKACTKKEFREDPDRVAKTRKSGVVEIFCGIAIIVMGFLRMK